jgi:hypothetical protein
MNTLLAFLLLSSASAAQVDQKRIDDAIHKGVQFLRTAKTPGVGFAKIDDSFEIVLLTMVHAGVSPTDPKFQELFKKMIEGPLERTYKVVLQAMILEEVERVKYQNRIVQCAQFLVDNQCANGQWSYGEPTVYAKETSPNEVASLSREKPKERPKEFGPAVREKPKVVRKIPVKKQKDGPGIGDNSNSMYAALGLRACHDAGVLLPREVVELAKKWYVECQHGADEKGGVATDGLASGAPRGWCYNRKDVCAKKHNAYAGMTAGGVGAVAICDYILEIDFKKDPAVRSGLAWLVAHWSVTENLGPIEFDSSTKTELYYYLYALERAGMLVGIEKIGKHDWYAEGAEAILAAQKPDGSWDDGASRGNSTWDTCFAVLFLKKATHRLDVASEDPNKVRNR